MNLFTVFLIIIFLPVSTLAALPNCADGVTCPPGGIWSEWSTSEVCSTSCGSCSKLYYKRTCLSENANCNCTGDTSRYLPCNTQPCKYPSERSCCIPYLPIVINRTSLCGPLPKDKTSSTTSCCPKNGLWSDWSGFGSVSDGWMQTRECVSTSAGCPCTGNSSNIQSSCPCPAMQTDQQVATACAGTLLWQKNNATTDDLQCIRTATLIASNDAVVSCHPYETYLYAPYVLFSTPTNTCPFDRPWNCEARKESGENDATLDITFTCNLEKLLWMYDYDGSFVNGYVQIQYDS